MNTRNGQSLFHISVTVLKISRETRSWSSVFWLVARVKEKRKTGHSKMFHWINNHENSTKVNTYDIDTHLILLVIFYTHVYVHALKVESHGEQI